MDVLLLVLGLLALLVAGVVAAGLARGGVLRRRHRRRVAGYAPDHVDRAALLGVASDGRTPLRGVGSLVAGADHLAFVALVAGRDVEVPRGAVTSARVTRTFMGHTAATDLLVVTWELQGLGDAAAFRVPDPATWAARLAPA